MIDILVVLVEFLMRLSFGTAFSMACTSGRQVTSGFFRVHLWMLLGFATLTTLIAYSYPAPFSRPNWLLAAAIALMVLSYVLSVAWLYERRTLGGAGLWLMAAIALAGAALAWPLSATALAALLQLADVATSGLLLGATLTAMLLGHWYLNTPTMQLAPLRRLLALIFIATALRASVSVCGLLLTLQFAEPLTTSTWLFLALRYIAGIAGVALFTYLARQTLKIPNTQSATGILYAAVILAFIGELTSQLLSASAPFPL